MSADYLPVHDPAVHGPAYAVRVTGQHTQPFPVVRPYVVAPLPALHGQYEQPCPYGCPVHPSPLGGDPRALLYAGPGIADRTWQARVREGAWDDIPALFDAAHANTHLPAIKRNRHIRSELSDGRHHLAAVFDADPPSLKDDALTADLRWLEAELASQLADLKTMGYRNWLETQPPSLRRAA